MCLHLEREGDRQMKAMKKKLLSRRGFTLAEVLMVVIILSLVGTIVMAGIPSAMRAYEKVVDGANAQLVLSTTVTSLRRELSLARDVKTSSGALQSYTNGETGAKNVTLDNSSMGIYRKTSSAMNDEAKKEALLVTMEAASKTHSSDSTPRLVSHFDSISYDKSQGVFTVTNLTVKRASDNQVLAEVSAIKIRSITES